MTMRFFLALIICSQSYTVGNAQSQTTPSSIQSIYWDAERSRTVVLGDSNESITDRWKSQFHLPLPTTLPTLRAADALDSTKPTQSPLRLTVLFLTTFKTVPFILEGTSSGQNYLVGVGFVGDQWWIPAPHVYFTYTRYTYERIWLTSEWKDIHSIAIYPSVKLVNFLLIGYGYSAGKKYIKRQDYSREPYVVFDGKFSDWSALIGLDFDLRIYRNAHATLGIYFKEPAAIYAIGIAVRL